MDKIVLIAPRSKGTGGADINPIKTPLTGLLTIATYLNQLDNKEIFFYDELIEKPNYDELNPDYLLISTMSATAKRAYEIADKFKEKETIVILGGIHASFKYKEALNHCDKVVIGEGELASKKIVKGNVKEDIVKGKKINDLNKVPLPDYDLVEGMKDSSRIAICASRGCGKSCKFCSINQLLGQERRTISNKKVVNYLKKQEPIETLCFDEPNFLHDPERAKDLLKKMKKSGINPKRTWISVSLDVAHHDDFLKLCSDISDFNYTIGLESIDKKTLGSYSHSKKKSREEMRKSIKKIHDYGIKIEGSFVFGSDRDHKGVFDRTVEFCQETEIDFPAFFPLTPYPGTQLRKEMKNKNKIFTNNWDYYDNLHTVFYPKNMSPIELQKGVIDSYKRFYSFKKSIKHLFKGEFFYSGITVYLKYLFWKMIRENKDYLNYLKEISD